MDMLLVFIMLCMKFMVCYCVISVVVWWVIFFSRV